MKKILRLGAVAFLFASTIVGCSSDGTAEDVLTTPTDPIVDTDTGQIIEPAIIRLTEGGAADDVFFAEATGEAGETVQGRVIFTTTSDAQKRLYVTQTLPDGTTEPFVIEELSNRGTKADGSIDLDGDNTDALDFTFTLDVPTDLDDGSYVYNFWSTSGRGDFRDTEKRQLIGVGTIAVTIGTGESDELVRSFDGVTMLGAPRGDGLSNTFMSVYNNEIYQIKGDAGLAAFWDFGYFYGNTLRASFASASNYPTDIIDIISRANDEKTEDVDDLVATDLNSFFFSRSSLTPDQFDQIALANELDNIAQSTSERVTDLQEGEIIEFVDAFGTKGLIRILTISGTFGGDDFISFDIKVQPFAPIISTNL